MFPTKYLALAAIPASLASLVNATPQQFGVRHYSPNMSNSVYYCQDENFGQAQCETRPFVSGQCMEFPDSYSVISSFMSTIHAEGSNSQADPTQTAATCFVYQDESCQSDAFQVEGVNTDLQGSGAAAKLGSFQCSYD